MASKRGADPGDRPGVGWVGHVAVVRGLATTHSVLGAVFTNGEERKRA